MNLPYTTDLVERYDAIRRLHTNPRVDEQREQYRDVRDRLLPLAQKANPALARLYGDWVEAYAYLGRPAVDDIESADKLAAALHIDQVDKAGNPYVQHVRGAARIAEQNGASVRQRMAALLHDSVEDTTCTLEQLTQLGVPASVVDMVDALTHRPDESQSDYLARLARTPDAILVKRSDIAHNRSPERLARLDSATRERLAAKYDTAIAILDDLEQRP